MATSAQVRTWVEQAKADLGASKSTTEEIRECHRRYWIQQAYEKAIKAYALIRWKGGPGNDAELKKFFLGKHSPLIMLEGAPKPSRELDMLKRELRVFMSKLPDSATLTKIDETTPSSLPDDVSYRYPFLVSDEYVAPASYLGWDVYQGEERTCLKAVEQLVKKVGDELSAFERRPK